MRCENIEKEIESIVWMVEDLIRTGLVVKHWETPDIMGGRVIIRKPGGGDLCVTILGHKTLYGQMRITGLAEEKMVVVLSAKQSARLFERITFKLMLQHEREVARLRQISELVSDLWDELVGIPF